MAVPAHDDRDYEFAKKYNLPIIKVLQGSDEDENSDSAMSKDGIHINSEFLNGLNKEDAINKMIEYLEENHLGEKKVNYRLREWILHVKDIGENQYLLFIWKMVQSSWFQMRIYQ